MSTPSATDPQAPKLNVAPEDQNALGVGTQVVGDEKKSSDPWQATLQRVLDSIVVIRINCVRSWDGNNALYSFATGFIVDAKRGIILTNRHVVTTGPVVADAVMKNKEEISLSPVYRDPIHDFGFYTYNVDDVKFMSPESIKLSPEEAVVGTEIRVVGNDAGEKISILTGTLARLDRNAPHYGAETYNDLNTFYYAAASNTSGGSSGSPVLNVKGHAIALNAGGASNSAHSYYLPLDRVVRALDMLQKYFDSPHCKPDTFQPIIQHIPRGTLRVVFKHKSFGEVERLALRKETEAEARKELPLETGLLVVDQVVPGGKTTGILESGDVLLKVNGNWCSKFVQLEEELDTHVGKVLSLEIERGGKREQVELEVESAHEIACPPQFLEASGAILHPLSYTQARNHNLPPGSVYIASSGYMWGNAGVPGHALVVGINDQDTPTLDDVENALAKIPGDKRAMLRYIVLGQNTTVKVAVFRMDRTWTVTRRYTRNDLKGLWEWRACAVNVTEEKVKPQALPTRAVVPAGSAQRSRIVKDAISSMVRVRFEVSYAVDGVHAFVFLGNGVVVDGKRGLILTDRNTVPTAVGDVTIIFGDSLELTGHVEFLHPVHNIAVVSYDPAHIASEAPSLPICQQPLVGGDSTLFVGLTDTGYTVLDCVVKELRAFSYSYQPRVPRFIAHNEDVLRVDQTLTDSIGGVFLDQHGKLQALLMSYSYVKSNGYSAQSVEGLPIQSALPTIRALQQSPPKSLTPKPPAADDKASKDDKGADKTDDPPKKDDSADEEKTKQRSSVLGGLDVEWGTRAISVARSGMGLSDEWLQRLEHGWNSALEKMQEDLRAKEATLAAAAASAAAAAAAAADAPSAASTTVLTGGPPQLMRVDSLSNVLSPQVDVRRQVLVVRRTIIGTDSGNKLKEGDLLLTINGHTATTYGAVERLTAGKPEVELLILRQGKELKLTVKTSEYSGVGTNRVVFWCGMVIQETYREVKLRGFEPPNGGGVYYSYYSFGSPAHKYGLFPKAWILEINGKPVPDLDTFMTVVKPLEDGALIRVKMVDLQAKTKMLTLKTDMYYWSTLLVEREDRRWKLSVL